jgi:cytochrome c556
MFVELLTFNSKLRAAQARMAEDHQRQLEHVQKTSEANADRTRRRVESEMADLKSNISKLEADFTKVIFLLISFTYPF